MMTMNQLNPMKEEPKELIKARCFQNAKQSSPREIMTKKMHIKKERKREDTDFCSNKHDQAIDGVIQYSYNHKLKGSGPPNAKGRNKLRYSSEDYGDEEEKKISRSNDAENSISSDAEFP